MEVLPEGGAPVILTSYGNHVFQIDAATRAILGTKRDSEVAAVLGKSERWVGLARLSLGIPAVKKTRPHRFSLRPEEIAILGTMSDYEAAKVLGKKRNWVRLARGYYGIAADCGQTKRSADLEVVTELVGAGLKGPEIADTLQVSKRYVWSLSVSAGLLSTPRFNVVYEALTMLGPQTLESMRNVLGDRIGAKIKGTLAGYVGRGYLKRVKVPGCGRLAYALTGVVPERFKGTPINQVPDP